MFSNKFYVKNRAIVPPDSTRDVHQERCDHDPLYCIIFFPERRQNLLLEFVKLGIAIIHKRYSIKEEHRVFGLLKTINDPDIRLFAVLFWIYKERSFMRAIEAEYDQKGMFGTDDINHFHSFVGLVGRFIDQTMQFPYDANNIMEMLDKFVAAVRLEYVTGPR